MKAFFNLLVRSYQEWKKDNAPKQAAALAYYTIFSLAPLVTIIITLMGWIYKESDVSSIMLSQVSTLIGESGREVFKTITEAANKPDASLIAAIMSTVTMLFGATGVFVQLKDALNTAWGIEEDKSKGLKGLLKVRAIAIASVIVIFFLLLISLVVSSVISSIMGRFSSDILIFTILIQIANQVVAVGLISLLFAFIFKYLPDTTVAWKDVWIGALFTSILFNVGKYLIGLYLGNSNVGSAFGAAGSILVVLVWVYYSALLLLFGAEFTQVYSESHGSKMQEVSSKQTSEETKAQIKDSAKADKKNKSFVQEATVIEAAVEREARRQKRLAARKRNKPS